MTALRAFYCPCCGARLEPPATRKLSCAYCDSVLLAEPESISDLPRTENHNFISKLSQNRSRRFEMSWLHQRTVENEKDLFHFAEFEANFSALIYLRLVDNQKQSLTGTLPLHPLLISLETYRDPGLAAHEALDWLCQQPQSFKDRLECAICLFDEERSRVTVYSAGCRNSIYWISTEQATVTDLAGHHEALERKMLAENRDHFSNQPPCELAAMDAVVIVSAGYAGRGDGPYASATSVLVEELRELLGEDPLRLVTLAKNAFWQKRLPAAYEENPQNSLHVIAIQARSSQTLGQPSSIAPVTLNSQVFQIACWSGPDDVLELLPLHNNRQVLVWASNASLPWTAEQSDLLRNSILEILDRPQHGDNDNPRVAGRLASQRVSFTRLVLILCLDEYQRVKYYRTGSPHPLYMPPRQGLSPNQIMAFDEGGEATLDPGSRLLFPGCNLNNQALTVPELATGWPGGKASHLYMTLTKLWTTPPSDLALQKILTAIIADEVKLLPGYFLLTSQADKR